MVYLRATFVCAFVNVFNALNAIVQRKKYAANTKYQWSLNPLIRVISLLATLTLTACGGGGGGGGSAASNAVPNSTATVISGNAVAGPIANGTVTAYAVTSSGSKGDVLGTTTTDANGAYSLAINYSGAIFLEITGGSFIDEATGNTINVSTTPGAGLQAVVASWALALGSNNPVHITPLTTMAAARALAMPGGLTDSNIANANYLVGYNFGFAGTYLISTQPINPLIANSATGATQKTINYGLILAGLSKQAQALGLSNPLDLVTALAQDLSDGSFDGKAGPAQAQFPVQLNGSAMDPTTGTAKLGVAISTFSYDTSRNLSGGTPESGLIAAINNNTVPDVTGRTQAEADALIISADLTIGSVTQVSSSTVAAGNVISQSPTAGNSGGIGTVINLTVSSGPVSSEKTETVLYSFIGWADGSQPRVGLIQGADGNFYGATNDGGTNGTGTIFKITPAGVKTVLHSFGLSDTTGANGNSTWGDISRLVQGTDGNFYGTTKLGGTNGTGTIFKITPAGVKSVLHSFGLSGPGADGTFPQGGLIQGADGNFYGVTQFGGTYNFGTVFKITQAGVETVLYSFGNGASGVRPGSLIQGTDGNFYGTTEGISGHTDGGFEGTGTVFKVTPGGLETVLHSFAGWPDVADGNYPQSLIQGTDGNFYGTTHTGGTNNWGTVFKITPAGVKTVLYSFFGSGTYGIEPRAGLIQGADGNFYGTTSDGGTYGGSYQGGGFSSTGGTVFKITPAGVETVLHSFGGGTDGSFIPSGLIQGTDGNIYGTTQFGGTYGWGTVFKITP